MEPRDWIALVAVVIGPISVLAGAWTNAHLARRSKLQDADAAARREALDALGRMKALLADAVPDLVLGDGLLEYEGPEQAVQGLYQRWLTAREPLVLLSVTHPSEDVRHLAFRLQAEVEMALRAMHKTLGGDRADATEWWNKATDSAAALGKLLTPFQ